MNNSGTHGESNSRPHASRSAAGGTSVPKRSPLGTVSHLVVVLHADDEPRAVEIAHAGALAAAMKGAVAPVEHEHVVVGFGQLLRPAKIDVIAVALAGQQGMHGVVEIVAPHAVQSVAAALARTDQADVVLVASRQ